MALLLCVAAAFAFAAGKKIKISEAMLAYQESVRFGSAWLFLVTAHRALDLLC